MFNRLKQRKKIKQIERRREVKVLNCRGSKETVFILIQHDFYMANPQKLIKQ